jgi:predicted nucleic acid-binding protein
VAETFVLDTSACFALLENEAGADKVESCLLAASEGGVTIHVSFVTLAEVEYVITQERGATDASLALGKIKAWPFHCLHSDELLCGAAAKLKAAHKISLADAFVAATAMRFDATLIHKDPEFSALAGIVKQEMLPPKSNGPNS